MDTFWKYFLGTNGEISFHLVGLLFCLFGTILAKYYYYKKHKAVVKALGSEEAFSLRYWLKYNIWELLLSMVASFVAVRFLNVLLEYANTKLSWNIPVTDDQVFYYLATGIIIQVWIHKMSRTE